MTLAERASANLVATYLAFGRALPGAEVRDAGAYVAVLSDLPHAMGNFAARLRLDPWSAAELRALAAERPAFQAVALPDDAPAHLDEILRRAGFDPVRRLVAMLAEPAADGRGALDVAFAEEPEDRLRAGRFFAEAFFVREPPERRDAMAEALAQASELSLAVYAPRDRPVASATLARGGGVLGVYNLAVAPHHRGQGVGKALVAWCLAQAAEEGLAACLQCVPTLEGWYARQGFVRTGTITSWALGTTL